MFLPFLPFPSFIFFLFDHLRRYLCYLLLLLWPLLLSAGVRARALPRQHIRPPSYAVPPDLHI